MISSRDLDSDLDLDLDLDLDPDLDLSSPLPSLSSSLSSSAINLARTSLEFCVRNPRPIAVKKLILNLIELLSLIGKIPRRELAQSSFSNLSLSWGAPSDSLMS